MTKDNLRTEMLEYLTRYGIYNVLSKYSDSKKYKETWAKGELAENLLECYAIEGLATVQEETLIIRNLTVYSSDKTSTLGEFDVCIVTPYDFNLLECKNWKGAVTVSDKCRVRNHNGSIGCNIYRKTLQPIKQLSRGLASASCLKNSDGTPMAFYKLGIFITGNKFLNDLRSRKNRLAFPVLDESTIERYIDTLTRKRDKMCWDVPQVRFNLEKLKEEGYISFRDMY